MLGLPLAPTGRGGAGSDLAAAGGGQSGRAGTSTKDSGASGLCRFGKLSGALLGTLAGGFADDLKRQLVGIARAFWGASSHAGIVARRRRMMNFKLDHYPGLKVTERYVEAR